MNDHRDNFKLGPPIEKGTGYQHIALGITYTYQKGDLVQKVNEDGNQNTGEKQDSKDVPH